MRGRVGYVVVGGDFVLRGPNPFFLNVISKWALRLIRYNFQLNIFNFSYVHVVL